MAVEEHLHEAGRVVLGQVLRRSRRMADTNAAGRPVMASANRSARRSCHRESACAAGRSATDTAPLASSSKGSPATSARLSSPGPRAEGAEGPVRAGEPGEDEHGLDGDRPPDVEVHVVRQLVRQDRLDLVVGVLRDERVGDENAAGAAEPHERGVGAPRPIADVPR